MFGVDTWYAKLVYSKCTRTHTAGNILVDDTAQRIKLTDFGCAEILEQKRMKFFSADPNAGTLSYNPPEVGYVHCCFQVTY